MSTGSAAFTTTHRVIDRVHDHTTVAGTASSQRERPGLAGTLERVLAVANHTDSGLAGSEDLAGLA